MEVYLQIINSLITPIVVVIIGFVLSRKIERNKIEITKEKEWQVKWADLFFAQSVEFSDRVSEVVCKLYYLQKEKDSKNVEKINSEIISCIYHISKIEWNIKNYVQFSPNFGEEVINTQIKVMTKIRDIIDTKKGNLEDLRIEQFRYNDAVRKAHAEMLECKEYDLFDR